MMRLRLCRMARFLFPRSTPAGVNNSPTGRRCRPDLHRAEALELATLAPLVSL
nr:MAG TPA: hypothetical protein [Inoviridae sp.]